MRICVYDVAAESGGALTILNRYYRKALSDKQNEYLFIIGLPELASVDNISVMRCPEVKRSWINRILFDWFKAPRMIRDFGAEEVLSLQNVLVPRIESRQIVYMHNVLPKPLCDYRFGLRDSPKMWVYQNIVGRLIVDSCRKADGVVVQTHWLARRLSERCGVESSRISVESVGEEIVAWSRRLKTSVFTFVYPASAEPFKNHQVVVDACRLLKSQKVGGFKVVFTLDGTENALSERLREQCRLESLPIEFAGWMEKEEIAHMYASASCLLFPSKLESWGLPLSEAKEYSLPIIVSDLEYAHETIGEYERVHYFDQSDEGQLAFRMKNVLLEAGKNG